MLEKISAKDGSFTLRKDGVFLLSAYQPERDAARLAPENVSGKFFVVFGECLGYTAGELIKRGCPAGDLFIVQPDGELLDCLPGSFRNRAATVGNLTALSTELESALLRRLKPELIVVPAAAKAYPEIFDKFGKLYRAALTAAVENVKVNSYFSRVWMLNFVRNLSQALGASNRFALDARVRSHLPVVVAAAGPSLAKFIPELKAHRSRFGLVSVLSAARTLIASGVRPDYIVVSDAGVANVLHFHGVPEDAPVLASVYANSALLSRITNPVIYYDLAGELDEPSLRLDTPSVAIDAGKLAAGMFAGGLLFCGLDLSYPSSAGTHSPENAILELRRHRAGRLVTYHSLAAGYLKRGDLTSENGAVTHAQFLMTREAILRAIPEACYAAGGLDFTGWKRFESVEAFLGVAAPKGETPSLPAKPIPDTRPTLEGIIARIGSDDEFAAKVFARQALASDFEAIRKTTLIKLNRLSNGLTTNAIERYGN